MTCEPCQELQGQPRTEVCHPLHSGVTHMRHLDTMLAGGLQGTVWLSKGAAGDLNAESL